MSTSASVPTLGLTGGIGSGKSTVARMLEELGARVFYADDEGKRILSEDETARAEVVARFGPESYRPDGSLDRAYLADRVFGDAEQLAHLNEIVHPRVRDAFEAARARAARDGVPLLVEEAALIFESGADRFLDAVAVVDAPLADRIWRVVARDNVTVTQVRARMRHQLPPEELRRRADFVLDNGESPEELRRQVERLYATLTTAEASD